MSVWEFCCVLERIEGVGIRVLEKDGNQYRERVVDKYQNEDSVWYDKDSVKQVYK